MHGWWRGARLLREGPFKDIWIQPASGDAGGSLGAALSAWHEHLGNARIPEPGDAMQGAYLGGHHTDEEIRYYLDSINARYVRLDDAELMPKLAELLATQNISDGSRAAWSSARGLWAGAQFWGIRAIRKPSRP